MTLDDVHRTWFRRIDTQIQFLMDVFGEMLEELGEAALAALLPWSGKSRRQDGSPTDGPVVVRELQALSIAFQLLNLVEESAAVQARRYGETTHGALYEPGLWGQSLSALENAGFTEAEIAAQLKAVEVEIVLTAHPTEAKRPDVLRQHRELFEAMQELDNSVWTEREREGIRDRIKVQLERLWRTGEIHLHKPEIDSELTHVLDYFRMVFPRVLPDLDQRLREAWANVGFDPEHLEQSCDLPRFRFGNWVGGDRDGHPLVTAATTERTLQRLRDTALEGVRKHLERLATNLPLSDLFQAPPEILGKAIAKRAARLGEVGKGILKAHPHEPWRCFAALLLASLPSSSGEAANAFEGPEELRKALQLLRGALDTVGAQRIAEVELRPIERFLDTFGFHTAALDIRQNSAYHEEALAEMLEAAGLKDVDYASWDETRRRAFLTSELESLRPLCPRGRGIGAKAQDILDTYGVVADTIRRHGNAGIGAFIVSMTRDVSDLLLVYVLAREVGLLRATPEGIVCDVAVVPLFETVEDLVRSGGILEAFLAYPITRRSLEARGGEPLQQVMLGYSDSGKGSGLFAGHWQLHRAQDTMAEVALIAGIDVQFFHGRGGTMSRGAGPTHRFLESLPHASLGGTLRVTEQGESIAQKYGNRPTAGYNLELLLAGVTATGLKHQRMLQVDPDFARIGERLNALSCESYQALLKEEGFLAFWSDATPIDALEQSFIGSRPARRTGRRTLEDLRAIPWVFSWIQSRYYLPSWYGLGSALQSMADDTPEDFELLQERVHAWPFVRYVLYNAETSLASADLGLMAEYAGLVGDETLRGKFYDLIAGEFTRSGQMIDRIFGKARAERRPRMEATLKLREDGLLKLHRRQIALLREWRGLRAAGEDKEAEQLLPALLLSVNAIASGQRTTG